MFQLAFPLKNTEEIDTNSNDGYRYWVERYEAYGFRRVNYYKEKRGTEDEVKRHRLDGPACLELKKGSGLITWDWYRNGLLHRDGNQPACIRPEALYWMQKGKLHRTDGPAKVFYDTNEKVYAIDGVTMSRDEFIVHYEFIHMAEYHEEDSWAEYTRWRDVDYSHEFEVK